jgi:formylglycine-generating enzyme required for sulfatase activity/predicted Ser/Thr protein kinase/dienelactone hydrolase
MSDNRWERVEEIFHRAVELAPEARSVFLDEACAADQSLHWEVASLLAHDSEADDTFAGPPGDDAPRTIAHYRISGKLGQGGMGTVYRATDTKLGREVAIKVLSRSFAEDADQMARFNREAKVLASLNHPNIAQIYAIEEHALVMELVPGETLQRPLPIEIALNYATQIVEALEAAHEKGIVHRDLKPANIMVTGEGHVKLLDFGLAQRVRLAESETGADSGESTIVGTIGYMSPEQVRGLPVDHRTDLFSFGVVLYEMVTQERPFTGSSAMAVCDAILNAQPRDFGDRPVPGKLKALIRKLLEKDPANRYRSAGEVQRELKALETSLAPVRPVRLSRNAWIAVWAAVVLVGVLAGWLWRASSRQRWALEMATPEIARLIDVGEYVKAAALAREARADLPKDPTIEKLWMRATGEVSIDSVPSLADVSFRPYSGDPNGWKTLGKTPLQRVRVPRDDYLWRVVKPGFAAIFFIARPAAEPPPGYHSNFNWKVQLRLEGSVPPDMVVVAGGWVGLGYPLATARALQVGGFLIDRHEVTNSEYRRFVDAGGYQKREFWKQPFVRNGRIVRWEDAMALFHDSKGRPGPATWEVGYYPKGREQYPVAGVSWYEAAAYAEFAGKSLPTAYHWSLASQSAGYTPLITPGSNFRSEGTQPVGRVSTLSGFGTTDMAGNVKEWCWNEGRDGRRFILGGGFGEPNYMFHHTDAQSPWDRLTNFGFRCVKLDSPPGFAALARIEVTTRDYWKENPVSDEVFKAYTELYAYDKGELNAKVEETASMEGWLRETVSFDAAYGHERVTAYLYLPKNAVPPFQTVVYFPGSFSYLDDKLDLASLDETRGFLVQNGRALIAPIYKGTYQRRDGLAPGGKPPAFFRDHVIAWSKDLGRSIDYLETRKDIDATKVAYFGDSGGAILGALLPAIEKRLKAEILSSGGFNLRHDLPEVAAFNFVKHVTIPVLMLNGRYDATFPLESAQRPLFHFLGTPANDKKHVIYEDGHGAFPRPAAVRESLDWLDKYLGPVRR